MKIKGIAFDLEGTVIDVEIAHHNGYIATAAEFGLTMDLDELYSKIPAVFGEPAHKVCDGILKLLEPEKQEKVSVEKIIDRSIFYYEQFVAAMTIEPRPGFLAAYQACKKMGLKLTIGSLTEEKYAAILLEKSGLSALFNRDHIVLREDVKNGKPAPDVFLKTAEIMGINPKDQLVFDDYPVGIKAALAAGSKAIGMPTVIRGSMVGTLVDAGAIRIFFDWRDINLPALLENI